MWHPISTAPFDRDLELGVADSDGVRAIPFPCRRVLGGWIKAETDTGVAVRPTHWREWSTDESVACSPRDFALSSSLNRSRQHTTPARRRQRASPDEREISGSVYVFCIGNLYAFSDTDTFRGSSHGALVPSAKGTESLRLRSPATGQS